jgi:penicillin G amidase
MRNRSSAPLLAGRSSALLLAGALAAACGDNVGTGGDGGPGADAAWDQVISIDGLDGPVSVYFDAQGILHARCESDADCFAAEGYFHAAHRFVQMDLRRRLGRGRLSALAGSVTLDNDRFWRMMMTDREGTPLEERIMAHADDRTIAALEAYSRGVNAWLADLAADRNGAALSDEYSFEVIDQDAIQDDWEPLDSVACILPLIENLNDSSQAEIKMGEVYGQLEADVRQDLLGLRPPSPSTILPPPSPARRGRRSAGRRARAETALERRLKAARPLFERALAVPGRPAPVLQARGRGSNNWAVSPDHGGGSALLANDPHLFLSHPAVWYLVNLDSKSAGSGSLHVAGASFAGLPGVVLGHNDDIAWGATTTYFDGADVYVETLNEAGDAVMFNGKEVPIETGSFQIEVSGGDPVTEDYDYVPHHGPILSRTDTTALSVRWIGHDSDTDINFLLALATATSVDEGRAALENITSAGQNFVIIDRSGDIGWFPYLRLPSRPWASAAMPPWLPLDGRGEAEWGAPIPYEDLPQAMNPPAGFVATANNDMTGALQDGDPTNDGYPFFQGLVDEGYRHQRIVERLAAEPQHDLASMQSIQADVHSLVGEALTPAILDAVADVTLEGDAQAVADALADWDFECPTGLVGTDPDGEVDPATATAARGCAAFHVTWSRLLQMTFADDLEGVGASAFPNALIFALTAPETLNNSYWDDKSTAGTETEADIVAAALTSAGQFLRDELGAPDGWLWGRIHTVTLRADLFDAAGVTEFNSDSYANDGGMFTVDVAHPADELHDDYDHRNGPSMRFACEANDAAVSCTIELPGGQRHHRDSDFYDSMFDEWLTNQPVPFLFGLDEAAAAAVESVRLVSP